MYFSLSAILQTSFCKFDLGTKFQKEGLEFSLKMLLFFGQIQKNFLNLLSLC